MTDMVCLTWSVNEIQPRTESYSGKKDREVQIVIAVQMAGSVWKSKHFKMKSSND